MAKPQGSKRPASDKAGGSPAKRQKAVGGGARPAHAAKGGRPGGKPGGKPGAKPQVPEKMSRKERKELERARKARKHKNFNLIQEVVQLWEEARRQDVTAEKRSKLVTAIMGKIQGRVAELAGSHSASRVIQTCAKHGTPAERAVILKELEPKLLELSKSPYGHFVVTKLISLAPKEQLPGLLKAFRGHLGELLRHPAGNHVVDELYQVADTRQRNFMAAEFYGKEYVLFEGGMLNNAEGAPAHLADLMPRVDGAKQRSIIQHMSKDLIPIMEKGLVDCPLVHRLLAEFMEFSPASVVADAAENLSGDPLLHMVHTKDGAKAACMALAYGTAKDRKKALKCMKGHVGAMARDEWGHLTLITALSVVDDTTLLRKSIVAELQKDLAELAEHKYGYRVLAQLLHPWCGRYLPPQLAAVARPATKEYSAEAMKRPQHEVVAAAQAAAEEELEQQGADGAAESDEDEEGGAGGRPTSGPLGLSKKDPDVRRKELLAGGAPASLAAALCALCAQQAGQLVRSQHGSDILVEVCRGGEGGLLLECLGDDAADQLAAVHDALVAAVAGGSEQAAAGEEEEEGGQQQQEPVLPHFFGSRALRRLVLASNDGGAAGEAAAAFAGKLWRGALAGSCKQWVDTHAAKVLAAVLHCGDAATKQAAAKELKPLVKGCSLDEWADRLTSKKGEGKQQQAGKQAGKQQAAKQQQAKQQQPAKQAAKQQQQAKQQPAKQPQQQPSAKKRKQKA